MPSMSPEMPPIVLHLADGAVIVIQVDETGQVTHTRIEPDGTTMVEVVPRLH
jgi:hypothetical protein